LDCLNDAEAVNVSLEPSAFCGRCGKALPPGVAFCPSCGAAVSAGPQDAAQTPISGVDAVMKQSRAQTYWVRRILAYAIDAIIVYAVLGVLLALAALPVLALSGPGVFGALVGGVFTFLGGFILVVYFIAFEVRAGESIGKRVMGLKVVVPGGRAPNVTEALVRNISKIYWLFLLLDIVVGLATSKGYTQKYTDRMMNTSVIDA
jgi:uncharacterized RDD family membrane protein YckC